MTLVLSSTVCLVYEVSLATHRAHASSLIVATAYVRFIRSTERMTAARPDQVGNSGPNGMDEPPFPPAGEPIPDEAEAVARDAVRPQDQLRGERHPPQQLSSRGCGQLTQRDQPSTSQELNRGRSADADAEFSSAHESRWDSTLTGKSTTTAGMNGGCITHTGMTPQRGGPLQKLRASSDCCVTLAGGVW